MGCGSSNTHYSHESRVKTDAATHEFPRVGQGGGQGRFLDPGTDDQEKPECNERNELIEALDSVEPARIMEEHRDEDANNDIANDDNRNSRSSTTDVITMDIKKGSERHELLKAATVDMFVEEGTKLIHQINDMPLNLEDMPENFKAARKLRLVYHNARYNMAAQFCILYLDKIMDEGLFSCLAKALRSLQEKWPDIFSETLDPKEVFKPPISKMKLSDFAQPEMAVASVWLKLNATVLGTTDLYEGCRIRAADEGVLEYFLMEALPGMSKGEYHGVKTTRGKLLQNAVSSIYNFSMATANVPCFEKFDGVNKLLKLIGTASERLNMTVLFALAYLIDEKNNHLIVSTNETIDKIIHFLTNANNLADRRYCGLSNVEIANALTRIAVNDDNKKMIGKRNGLLPLVKMFSAAKSDDERISSTNALWMLLFDTDNQKIFMEIDDAFEKITAHANSENKALSKAISGIVWEVKTKYELQKKADSVTDVKETANQCKHVMISYNWEQQELMLKIRDTLKNSGYKVWMDVDKIGGSTLEAMASAVENSAVILVAVSRKYKESANCRSEAEYAFQLRKSIVPLMVEKNYQPDGWLGFVVGAKYWIDFTTRLQFKDDTNKLIREIGDRGKVDSEMIIPVDDVDLGAPMGNTLQTETERIKSWTNDEVKEWLCSKNHLDKKLRKSILDKLTGRHLISLQKLHNESPEFFFSSVRADFGFNDVLDQLDFTDAVQELMNCK